MNECRSYVIVGSDFIEEVFIEEFYMSLERFSAKEFCRNVLGGLSSRMSVSFICLSVVILWKKFSLVNWGLPKS